MNRGFPCKNLSVAGLLLAWLLSLAHSTHMRNTSQYLLTFCLACLPLFAQANPGGAHLHDGFVLEQEGQFASAVNTINATINSRQLNGTELGRAYVMLGFAYHQLGNLVDAQSGFENALRILEHDSEHKEDYAAALNDYAGLLGDAGQLDAAAPMWAKALHLRQEMGDHAEAMRSLIDLADMAIAQKHLRRAKEFINKASHEMNLAHDLTEDDLTVFLETQGWLALAEGHASAAVAAFQRALDMCVRTRGEQHWLTGWEYIQRGNAYAQSGDVKNALRDMQTGLAILDHTLGRGNVKYFAAEIAYSRVLDRAGSHVEAARLREVARQDGKDFYSSPCVGCTINAASLR
jgi:tetratricopeptide (TPR) repeat protein